MPRLSSRRAVWTILAAALLWTPVAMAEQQAPRPNAAPVRDAAVPRLPATGTGSIAGVVRSTDADSRPIRRARVTLSRTEQGGVLRLVVATDDQGRFRFAGLPTGRFSVSASLTGWVSGTFGGRAPGGQGLTLALSDGQQIEDVVVGLTRGAVITGRVTDSAGQPAVGARVLTSERRVTGGAVSYQSAFAGLGNQTDDRGMYRIYGLRAGTYIVSVTPPAPQSTAGRIVTPAELQWAAARPAPGSSQPAPPAAGPMSVYAQVYYPGGTDVSGASPITIAAGEERAGVDVTLQLVPTVKLSGVVLRPDGQRASGAQVVVAPIDQPLIDPFALLTRNMMPRNSLNGEFSFLDLQPGRYTISARAASGADGPQPGPAGGRGAQPPVLDLWASAEVTVGGSDIDGLSLTLQPGMTMSGRVVFEGTTPPPADLSRVQVRFAPPPSQGAVTISTSVSGLNMVAPDGSFSIRGLSPGPYEVSAFAPGTTAGSPAWFLKSVVSGGRSLLDQPFELRPGGDLSDLVVVFSDRVTEISGTLLDRTGRPAPEFYVIVFPTDPARWAQRSRWLRPPTRPANDGHYRIAGLPPGEFYLAALTEFDQNEWWTPAFLEQVVPGAIKITVGEGEKKVQDVRLGI